MSWSDPMTECACTHLCETSSVEDIFCGLRGRFLAKPRRYRVRRVVRRVCKTEMGRYGYLAYAAFHCSSRRVFAASSSS